jgi:hypothetical protein
MLRCLWITLKDDWERLRFAAPGRRFRDFRRYKLELVQGATIGSRIFKIGMGILLVLFGLGIGWLPGPGGFLAVLGLAVLVPFIPGMAYLMDRTEIWIRRCASAVCKSKG